MADSHKTSVKQNDHDGKHYATCEKHPGWHSTGADTKAGADKAAQDHETDRG